MAGEEFAGVDPSVALLLLDVEMKPNTLGYILQAGTCLFKLKLAASNHPPRDYTLEVKFEGKWFDDESKMFSDGFGMRLL